MTTLTLKPTLLRADTIDLQSHENPSAKDHTRGTFQAGYSHTGTHHAQSLRNASHDALQEQQTSPHLGGFQQGPRGQQHVYDEGDSDDDDHDINGHDETYGEDGDSEDDMDDDMLDKISSSPSIEDGKLWPPRSDSLQGPDHGHEAIRAISLHSHSPAPPRESPVRIQGVSLRASPQRGNGTLDFTGIPRLSPCGRSTTVPGLTNSSSTSSLENVTRHLLPEDDPFLDNTAADHLDKLYNEFEEDWIDEETIDDSSDDEFEDYSLSHEARFIDSGWGGECLREIEDINFEFVYALHTFVATVEGQANATKGDTMVLLDDSNSYWWLVRVVKDGSIGYLPAEHIETPTERLARLNKHRNIDLSAAMLGDNPEKSKNPLKKAMRRRNAKTVNFAPPTYHEPPEQDWSDEEEELNGEHEIMQSESVAQTEQQVTQQQQATQQTQQAQQVQAVQGTTQQQRADSVTGTIHRVENEDSDIEEPSSPVKVEAPAPLQTHSQDHVSRSRNGTVRNTDSFFKDQETKKISLTPRLLRNDETSVQPEQDVKQRPSLDTFDKITADEKSKDGKKKEKKGMLSGLFKRKDKSGKGSKADAEEPDRTSEDSGRSPLSKDSMESDYAPERKPSKLQKHHPPAVVSPRQSPTETRAPIGDFAQNAPIQVDTHIQQEEKHHQIPQHSDLEHASKASTGHEKRSVFAPIAGALRSKNSSQDLGEAHFRPVHSKKAKERFAIDESGSEDDHTPTAQTSALHRSISPVNAQDQKSRPDSTMRVSPMDTSHAIANQSLSTPPIEQKTFEQRPPVETPTSPSDQTASTSKQSPSIPTHTPSTSRSTPTWSDASLRSYMSNDQDIRDLLVIVHDKSNVMPVGPEHPLINGLFASERTKLADMQTQLDSMLLSWLSKKNQPVPSKV